MTNQGVSLVGFAVGGLVVDVSIKPGLKLIDEHGHRTFVDLEDSDDLETVPRPDGIDSRWFEQVIDEHLGREP